MVLMGTVDAAWAGPDDSKGSDGKEYTCCTKIKALVKTPTAEGCKKYYKMESSWKAIILWSHWQKYLTDSNSRSDMEMKAAALAAKWGIKSVGMTPIGQNETTRNAKLGCTGYAYWENASRGYLACAKKLNISDIVFMAIGAPGKSGSINKQGD